MVRALVGPVTSALELLVPSTTVQCAAPHVYLVLPVVCRVLPALLVTVQEVLSLREVLFERVLPKRSSPESPKFVNARAS